MKTNLTRCYLAWRGASESFLQRFLVRVAIRATLNRLRPRQITTPLIRIGGDYDGGYLLPGDFEGIGAVFSPGVDITSSFEEHFLNSEIPCFLMDASVDQPPIAHPLLSFRKMFLGPISGEEYLSLEDWVRDFSGSGDLILQMDIEGGEWEILSKLDPTLLKKFRLIVIEIHGLAARLRNSNKIWQVEKAIRSLTQHHTSVHFHPNNCCGSKKVLGRDVPEVAEITLVRRDAQYLKRRFAPLPHPLDRENVTGARLSSPWER